MPFELIRGPNGIEIKDEGTGALVDGDGNTLTIGSVPDGDVLTRDGDTIVGSTGGGGGSVVSIVPGAGIAVDATDPANPIVSSTATGNAIWGQGTATITAADTISPPLGHDTFLIVGTVPVTHINTTGRGLGSELTFVMADEGVITTFQSDFSGTDGGIRITTLDEPLTNSVTNSYDDGPLYTMVRFKLVKWPNTAQPAIWVLMGPRILMDSL